MLLLDTINSLSHGRGNQPFWLLLEGVSLLDCFSKYFMHDWLLWCPFCHWEKSLHLCKTRIWKCKVHSPQPSSLFYSDMTDSHTWCDKSSKHCPQRNYHSTDHFYLIILQTLIFKIKLGDGLQGFSKSVLSCFIYMSSKGSTVLFFRTSCFHVWASAETSG